VLVLGVIVPLDALIERPAGAEYTPPLNAPVPVSVTACGVVLLLQKGPAYVIDAVGNAVMVTLVVAVTTAQLADAGIV
jgi:hypothetical protein